MLRALLSHDSHRGCNKLKRAKSQAPAGQPTRDSIELRSALEKAEQLLIDLVLHRRAHAVGGAFPDDELCALDKL